MAFQPLEFASINLVKPLDWYPPEVDPFGSSCVKKSLHCLDACTMRLNFAQLGVYHNIVITKFDQLLYP